MIEHGDWREFRDVQRKIKNKRLGKHEKNNFFDDFVKHAPYHWSTTLNGKRLDFWPSKNKFMFEGKVMVGDVVSFINKMDEV